MTLFLQGFLVGIAAVIGVFVIYLKIDEIKRERKRKRHKKAQQNRKRCSNSNHSVNPLKSGNMTRHLSLTDDNDWLSGTIKFQTVDSHE